ncbi:BgTH12-05596 [Blumeria graminis f. sp. triticale]|nr:BgTH12-05596 [Blumeria graminis f. sp. triticale]
MDAITCAKLSKALTIDLPFPNARLATIALRALHVDEELSPLVHRSLSIISPSFQSPMMNSSISEDTVLRAEYRATTNRLLRVAINGFMESLGVVIGVMEELDVEVFESNSKKNITAKNVHSNHG